MLVSLAVCLIVALVLLFSGRSVIERCVAMKITADVLAVFVLGSASAVNQEGLRSLALIVVIMGTLFSALLMGWSFRSHLDDESMEIERQ